MATAAWPVQVAMRAKLLSDPQLLEVVSGVFDYVDGTATFPYLTVGQATEVPDDAHDAQGLAVTVTIHVWSKYKGFAEALAILGHVDRLLDRQPLAVAGFTDVSVAREFHETLRDPDPQIRHIPVRFRIWLTKEN
ncbi:DUF3168 domain-containing protein [Amycolatopsis palatopharyngis]|uniref:DUF3168 domain-containing protein n=1 Tax=Amycolatopsis palatopharyngis TaxID=187982 RepID=UPI000E23ED1B|nr:DUF3168 domain-containing protein [Amycolatopsis palatopharyngis]